MELFQTLKLHCTARLHPVPDRETNQNLFNGCGHFSDLIVLENMSYRWTFKNQATSFRSVHTWLRTGFLIWRPDSRLLEILLADDEELDPSPDGK